MATVSKQPIGKLAIFEFRHATEDKTDLIPLMVVEGISQYARNIIRPPANCPQDGNYYSY